MDERAGEEKDARYVKWNTRCLARANGNAFAVGGMCCGCVCVCGNDGNKRSLTDGNGLLHWWG